MKEDCRNDCLEKLRFPKTLVNRPGLSHFDYRIGNYVDIREALLRNLDKTPGLSQWTHRGADDPGIALLEGAAILGDILTFYQERYANEAYLRTAEWRESISDLVRLLGYRLSPGLGGHASFAFEVKGDQPVVVPPNFPLKADIEGMPAPVDFETFAPENASSSLTAYPWLSKFNLYRPLETPDISADTTEFFIQTPDQLTAATPVVLKAGDRLLLGTPNPVGTPTRIANPEIVIVDSIRVQHGMKIFKIKGKLQRRSGPATPIVAYKLGRSFHHFGHNGPRILVKAPDPIKSKATKTSDTVTKVESDPPLEFNISFRRKINDDTVNDTITPEAARPRVQASSGLAAILLAAGSVVNTGASGTGTAALLGSNMGAVMSNQMLGIGIGGAVNLGQSSGAATTIGRLDLPQMEARATPRATPGQPLVIVEPSLRPTEFPLDGEVQDLATGVTLIVQGQFYSTNVGGTSGEVAALRDVSSIRTTSVTWGLSTGTVSMVTLANALSTSTDGNNFMDIAQVQLHEALSPLLTLRAAFQPAASAPRNTFNFYGTLAQAQDLNGRALFLVPATGDARKVNVTHVDPPLAGEHPLLHRITINADQNPADFPNDPPYSVTVYGNVVEATQGKTVALAPLGNGDSRLTFQTFKLPKSPLTYFHSDTPPEVPRLKVYVNNRLWKRVPSFFNRKPDEEIYIVREDPDNVSWVQFGDGKTGARVPSGVKNVTAVYRIGTGAFGKLKEKAKVQASAKLDRLDKIQMPGEALDGAQPEGGDNARIAAPGKIQSLDRLVSLEDYESEALGLAGVTKAAARVATD